MIIIKLLITVLYCKTVVIFKRYDQTTNLLTFVQMKFFVYIANLKAFYLKSANFKLTPYAKFYF